MTLSPIEAEAFLRIWSTVDAYVCRRTGVLPDIERPEQMRHRPVEDLAKVRKALWSNPHLLDDCVRDNPFSLSPPELEDVRRFRHSVRGRFFVERHLKDYAVFVTTSGDQKVLAVRGITDAPREVIGRIQPLGLAAMVEAVLLPFRGRIVWDGLVRVLPISFGPGIRRGFRDAYLYVEVKRKEFGSLEPQPPITLSSTTHIPLGRMKFMGTAERWEYQPYSRSDEYWDERERELGTPEDLMLSMVVRLG